MERLQSDASPYQNLASGQVSLKKNKKKVSGVSAEKSSKFKQIKSHASVQSPDT